MKNAAHEVLTELEPGETVEAVVFGAFGWGSYDDDDDEPAADDDPVVDDDELTARIIPREKRAVPLTWEEAAPLMAGWSFYGGYGAPSCYATYIYTNHRIFYVSQYDGATSLRSLPRHPVPGVMPQMPGG